MDSILSLKIIWISEWKIERENPYNVKVWFSDRLQTSYLTKTASNEMYQWMSSLHCIECDIWILMKKPAPRASQDNVQIGKLHTPSTFMSLHNMYKIGQSRVFVNCLFWELQHVRLFGKCASLSKFFSLEKHLSYYAIIL